MTEIIVTLPPKFKPCAYCGGAGFSERWEDSPEKGGKPTLRHRDCELCHGTGKVGA